jgi:hypothetical protein
VDFGGCGGKADVLQKGSTIKGHSLPVLVSTGAARDGMPRTEAMGFQSNCKGPRSTRVGRPAGRLPPDFESYSSMVLHS